MYPSVPVCESISLLFGGFSDYTAPVSFSIRSVSYQRKIGDEFLPAVLVLRYEGSFWINIMTQETESIQRNSATTDGPVLPHRRHQNDDNLCIKIWL
jgi:hypothetical protein